MPARARIEVKRLEALERLKRTRERQAREQQAQQQQQSPIPQPEFLSQSQPSPAAAPAIRLAEQGFPVSPLIARSWAAQEDLLREASPQGGELLIDGRAPRPAELWTNPGLANVMHELAEGGADAYYEGRAATAIVDALASLGGRMSAADLAGHRSTFEPPISTTYRGHRVHECAPNGQGLTALIALNILEGFDVAALPARSTAYLHTAIEALRLAFADARTYIADPEAVAVPTAGLLAKQYAADRRQLIDPANATADPAAGSPLAATDTVYLSAVDGEGNACSFINSNCWGFGTGIVPAGCGFSLQNRGTCFRLTPGHPNALGPNKRPYHTIIPAVATRADGSLFACFGVMGGFHQPQGHVQVLVNLIDRAMDPQSALDEPRFSIQPHPDNEVYLEESVPEAVRAELRRMGHSIVSLRDLERAGPLGKGQIIVRDPESGVLIGGSDPRGDGAAVGF